MKRRTFLWKSLSAIGAAAVSFNGISRTRNPEERDKIISVNGILEPESMGFTLSHEHLLVDFSGAAVYDPDAWDRDKVMKIMLPYLSEIKKYGCRTFVDCTPEFLGRDPLLLKELSRISGLNILTNTGLYGASDNKYLPEYAFRESAGELAQRWIREFREGIAGTGIRPGFIKIGVNNQSLSEVHKKLVEAAAMTHLQTGLTIASHTGGAIPAFEEILVLREQGVDPSAFIWVHAQMEHDPDNWIKAAVEGTWISLDGVSADKTGDYVSWLTELKNRGLLKKVLVSHDAGWYTPGQVNGGSIRGFTDVFEHLIPALREDGFNENDLDQIFVRNPARALRIKVRQAGN